MGSKPVPSYANIFIAQIDKQIKAVAKKYNKGYIEALTLLKNNI